MTPILTVVGVATPLVMVIDGSAPSIMTAKRHSPGGASAGTFRRSGNAASPPGTTASGRSSVTQGRQLSDRQGVKKFGREIRRQGAIRGMQEV